MSRRKGKAKQRTAPAAAVHKARRTPAATRAPNGRVHLVLHPGPHAASAVVTLAAPLFAEAWQNELAASSATTTYRFVKDAVAPQRVIALARHAMDATSQLAEGLLARAPDGAVACRAGCDHCCYQAVGVTPAEALAIVDHLQRQLSDEAKGELIRELASARERTRGLSSQERYSPDHPCPFLKSARCSIYEVRPLSCRGMNSLDAGECHDNLRDPEARAAFLARNTGGRSYLEPIRAVHAISAGMQLGLSELFALDMRPLDLIAAVHLLLTEPVAERWLTGEPALEAALSHGSSTQLFELSGALGTAKPAPKPR